jgi:protein-tyrosine-phosphatase
MKVPIYCYSALRQRSRWIIALRANCLHCCAFSMEDIRDITEPGQAASGKAPGNILVLCTHNAVRSPMTEAMLRAVFIGRAFVSSAGVNPDERMNRFAIKVMKEIGLPVTTHRPRAFFEVAEESFDLVIALSEPAFALGREITRNSGASLEFWETPEPPGLMAGLSQNQLLESYRRLRDELRGHVRNRFGVTPEVKSGLQ